MTQNISEETLRMAMEQAPIGQALVAPDGKFLMVNNALCALTGYSKDELLKRDFHAITHPDDLKADLDYVQQMLAGTIQTYTMEKRYIQKSGIIWVSLHVSLVRHADGSPNYFIAQIQDITGRKEIENMKSKFIATVSHESMEPL